MLVMERIFAENHKKQIKKRPAQMITAGSNDLLNIYDEAVRKKEHPYELLKRQGFIKNPFEEFGKAK